MADQRPTVFISYAQGDEFTDTIRQRLEVLLRRPIEDAGGTLFVDKHGISAGDDIDNAVNLALDASVAAVLLVNPQFLDSDYIRDTELPRILDLRSKGKIRVFPILLEDCLWSSYPHFRRMLLFGGGTTPLLELSQNRGRLSKFLADVAREVLKVVPQQVYKARPIPNGRPGTPVQLPSSTIAESHDYFARANDLATVVKRLRDPARHSVFRGTQILQICGEGGAGKSVLASMIAIHPQIRDIYPDGIHWVALGETNDVLTAQASLSTSMGLGVEFTSAIEGANVLTSAFSSRRSLVILDDARSGEDVKPLVVTGPNGATLVTSRHPLLAGVDTHLLTALDEPNSVRLLGSYLSAQADRSTLPRLVDSSSGLPLTLALIGAALREGHAPQALEIAMTASDFDGHPQAPLLTAVMAVTSQLKTASAKRLRSLLVFRDGQDVPETLIAQYWSSLEGRTVTVAEVKETLRALASLQLMTANENVGVLSIGIHDLTRDYLQFDLDIPIEKLHERLLASLGDALNIQSDYDWAFLPAEESYLWDNLAFHFEAARRPLANVVLSSDYVARRVCYSGWPAIFSDLDRAARQVGQAFRAHRIAEGLRRAVAYLEGDWSVTDLKATLPLWAPMLRTDFTSTDPPQFYPSLPLPSARPQQESGAFLNSGWILCAAPKHDTHIVVGTVKGLVFEVDSTTLLEHSELVALDHSVRAVASYNDVLAVGLANGQICFVESSRRVNLVNGHVGGVRCISASDAGFISGGDDGFVLDWRPPFGAASQVRRPPPVEMSPAILCLATSIVSGTMAWGSDDGRVWIRRTGRDPRMLPAHFESEITALRFAEHGRLLAVVTREGIVSLWSMPDMAKGTTFNRPGVSANGIAFEAGDSRLAVGWEDGELTWHDIPSLNVVNRFVAHSAAIRAVAPIRSHSLLATAGDDGAIRLWRAPDLSEPAPTTARLGRCRAIAGCGSAGGALVGTDEGVVAFCDLRSGEAIWRNQLHDGPVLSVAVDVTRNVLMGASVGSDRRIHLFELATGRHLGLVEDAHADWIRRVAFSPHGFLLTAGDDGAASVRDVDELTRVETQMFPGLRIRAAAFAADGRTVALGASNGYIYVWRPFSNKEPTGVPAHQGPVRCLQLDPEAGVLVSGSDAGCLRTWSWPDLRYRGEYAGGRARIRAVSFVGNPGHFLSGDSTGHLVSWEIGTHSPETRLQIGKSVRDLSYVDPGRLVLFASDEGWGALGLS